jgi:hypothetical protein
LAGNNLRVEGQALESPGGERWNFHATKFLHSAAVVAALMSMYAEEESDERVVPMERPHVQLNRVPALQLGQPLTRTRLRLHR